MLPPPHSPSNAAASLETKVADTSSTGISMADLVGEVRAKQARQQAIVDGLLADACSLEHASPEKRAALMARIRAEGPPPGRGVVGGGGDPPSPPRNEHTEDLEGPTNPFGDDETGRCVRGRGRVMGEREGDRGGDSSVDGGDGRMHVCLKSRPPKRFRAPKEGEDEVEWPGRKRTRKSV